MVRNFIGALLVLSAAVSAQAATYQVEFSALVTYSVPGSDLPSAGQQIGGRVTFDYAPDQYLPQQCGLDCMSYTFLAPYTFTVDLITKSVSVPLVGIAVQDNTPFYDPQGNPLDVLSIGTRLQAPPYLSYSLLLVGQPNTFVGDSIPSPEAFASQWLSSIFRIKSFDGFTVLLSSNVQSLQVSTVPEPAIWCLLCGGLLILQLGRRQPSEA